MGKKLGWLFFGLWVLAWVICAGSIVASEPIVTGDNVGEVAQNAPAMLMKAWGCLMLAAVGGLVILSVCGIFSHKKSN
jgi:Na+/proline symporter